MPRVALDGRWWASWQTSRNGVEKIASQPVEIRQEEDSLQVTALTPGLSEEDAGYLWSGELRLWDDEVLMGWYAAIDGSARSKGTMYFVLDSDGVRMSGRWVGLGFDGQIMTGWGSMGRTQDANEATMSELMQGAGAASQPGTAPDS